MQVTAAMAATATTTNTNNFNNAVSNSGCSNRGSNSSINSSSCNKRDHNQTQTWTRHISQPLKRPRCKAYEAKVDEWKKFWEFKKTEHAKELEAANSRAAAATAKKEQELAHVKTELKGVKDELVKVRRELLEAHLSQGRAEGRVAEKEEYSNKRQRRWY